MAKSLTAEHRPSPSELVRPYVPRVLVEWLREAPDERHRVVDGTLAMLDISGFTELTERLQRRGKAGAEELAEVLEEVFSDLLSVAYADGANLLKWGGDGRVRTSVGEVRLQMCVGVHSGSVHLFLVGDVHRELLVAGHATSQTVRAESAAAAGEVLLSPETAALLDRRFLGTSRREGAPLRVAPANWMRAPYWSDQK